MQSAEGSISSDGIRTVADSYDFQWFSHSLPAKYFSAVKRTRKESVKNLGRYFIERVNPTLVNPYSIFYENRMLSEPYKFISGSLEKLKEVMIYAFIVCEATKRGKAGDEKIWFSPNATVTCGNLRYAPKFEHATEWFINQVGTLAIKENAPYTVLDEGYGRRGGESYDWTRKKKQYLYFNFQEDIKNAAPRTKIAARFHLVEWLKNQGAESERIIKDWKLEIN